MALHVIVLDGRVHTHHGYHGEHNGYVDPYLDQCLDQGQSVLVMMERPCDIISLYVCLDFERNVLSLKLSKNKIAMPYTLYHSSFRDSSDLQQYELRVTFISVENLLLLTPSVLYCIHTMVIILGEVE